MQHFPSRLRRKSVGKPNKSSRPCLYILNVAPGAGFPPEYMRISCSLLCCWVCKAALEPTVVPSNQQGIAGASDQWSCTTPCITARQLLELHSAVLLQAALQSSTGICIAAISSVKWRWSLSPWQLINEQEYNDHNVVFYRIWAFNPRPWIPFQTFIKPQIPHTWRWSQIPKSPRYCKLIFALHVWRGDTRCHR